jgi:hypothetical protein
MNPTELGVGAFPYRIKEYSPIRHIDPSKICLKSFHLLFSKKVTNGAVASVKKRISKHMLNMLPPSVSICYQRSYP